MPTERSHSAGWAATFKVWWLAVFMLPALASAQTDDWRADQELDLAMGALERPIWQPILLPGVEQQRGMPRWPIYKQEPPAAQRDFRSLTAGDAGQVPPGGGGGTAPPVGQSPGVPDGGMGEQPAPAPGGPPSPNQPPPNQVPPPNQAPPPQVDPPEFEPPPIPGPDLPGF